MPETRSDNPALLALLPHFGLPPGRLAPEHPLPGSPERCIERFAVQDAEGRAWMLERIPPEQARRREELGSLLASLSRDPALAPLLPAYRPVARTVNRPDQGETPRFVLRSDDAPHAGCWMLSPFVAGPELPRPSYLDDDWRGEAVGRAILALQRAGRALPALLAAPQAALASFRDELFAAVTRHKPQLLARLNPVREALTELAAVLKAVPSALAHGDLHPLNVIWGADAARPLRALIDWEFAGARPRLYDAANCIGCAGFEHPSGLARGFVTGLVRELRAGGMPGPELGLLPLFVLVTRLGWLSEWLRKKDAELLDMELDYLDILLDEQENLAALWCEG